MKRWLAGLLGLFTAVASAQNVTLIGQLQGSNGLPSSNYSISFVPSQWFYIAGAGVVINSTSYCATSTDGSVVGQLNPLIASIVTPAFTGTLPAGNYYSFYTFYTAGGQQTLPSPETVTNLSGTGELNIAPPPGPLPAGVVGMKVYVGPTSGSELLQGSTTGTSVYVQSIPLTSGANPPTSNNTICTQIANDAGWPTGTGYTVSIADSSGNTLPGYPMMWQLLGPNTTINLSNGLPYYHGVVTFPVPILATPQNHAAQSISGPLSMTGYDLVNVGHLGVGTGLPAWGVDVEGSGLAGMINAKNGYLVNGNGGTAGQCLISDGTAFDTPAACLTTAWYQTIIVGSHASDAVTQRPYLAVGSGTGLTAVDALGVGSQVSRTVLEVAPYGGSSVLGTDPFTVVTEAGGTAGTSACWDGTASGIASCATGALYRVTPTSSSQPSYPVSVSASTPTTLLTETVTFPSAAGTYRASVSYGAWLTVGANPCAAQVVDTTNNQAYALSGQNSNGTGYIGLSGAEISSFTYAPSQVATFTLQVVCTNGAGGLSGATAGSPTLDLFPTNEPTYLSVAVVH